MAMLLAVAALPRPALAQAIVEFPVSGAPTQIVSGPDGNLWFTEFGAQKTGRITPAGSLTEFALPPGNSPVDIALGSDGNLWVTTGTSGSLYRITTVGILTGFNVGFQGTPWAITSGSDGHLWVTEASSIGLNYIARVNTGGILTGEFVIPTPGCYAGRITAGPDGNLWFTENEADKIGRITTTGAITEFVLPTGAHPFGIVSGPDGNLWFAEEGANKIGRITTAGDVAEFPIPTPSSGPRGVALGPDGNLWFTESSGNKIGRITPAGVITEFVIPTSISDPIGITGGPDGRIWFCEFLSDQIGRLAIGPTVSSISPSSGPSLGGTPVTIAGTGFVTGAAAAIGGSPANVTSVTPTQILASTGPHAASTVDVVVVNPGSGVGTLANAFTYTCSATAPTATLSGTTTICSGQSTDLSVALTGTGPFTLLWSDGFTQSSIAASPATRSVSPGSTTSYSLLSVADTVCAGTGSGTAVVTVNATPSAAITVSPVVCLGASNNAYVPDAGAGATYAWTLTNGSITSGLGTNAITFLAAAPGPIVLSVTVAKNGCSASSTANLTASLRPTATVSGGGTICSGSSANVQVDLTGAPPWTVTFSDGTSQFALVSPLVRAVWPGGTTTYTVPLVVDATTCSVAATGSAPVIVNPTPSAAITAAASTCPSSTGNAASVPAATGGAYAWTIAGGTITAGAGTNAITFTAGASGVVTLGVSVTAAGCTGSATRDVAISAPPTATVSGGGTVCAGNAATIQATLTGSAPWHLTWSDGFAQTVGASPVTRNVTPGTTTTYTVTALSDAACAGSGSGGATVTVNALPTADVSGNATICSGDSTVITAVISGAPPISVKWSDGDLQTGLTPGIVTRTVSPRATTLYQVEFVADARCTSSGSGAAFVAVAPDPSAVAIVAPDGVCANASGLHASIPDSGAGATYAWTITGGTITGGLGTRAVTFTAGPNGGAIALGVTVSIASGCSITGGKAIVSTLAPQTPAISGPASARTEEAGLAARVPTHVGSTYAWTIENGAITSGNGTDAIVFTAGLPGTTTLRVVETNPQRCSSVAGVLTIPVSGLTATSVVPVVLDVAGAGGSRFTTELTLANPGPAPATVDLVYTAADSLSAGGSGTVHESLLAGRQLVIPDAVAYLRGKGLAIPEGAAQGGTVRVTFRDIPVGSMATAVARTTAPSGNGRSGLAYGAPRLESLTAESVMLFGLRQTANDRSNLALENAGATGPVTLRVTLHSGQAGDGRKTVLPDVTLAPGQWRQLNGVLAEAGYANGWAQVTRVAGSDPFLAYAVFNDNGTSDGSYVSAVPADRPAGSQVLPVLVESATFASELILANPGTKAVDVTLSFTESLAHPGGSFGGSVKETLQPGEQRIISDAIEYLRGRGATIGPRGPSYSGALSASFSVGGVAAAGFVGARTSAASAAGRYGLFCTGSLANETAVSEAWVFGLVQDARSRSNLAFANGAANRGPVVLRYEVFDGSTGAKAGESDDVTLGPGGWTQVSGVLSRYSLSNGYVRVVKVSGTPGFLAYGVVNDGATSSSGTNDGSYVVATVP